MATFGPPPFAGNTVQFDSTIGPFVVGTFLALFLQGITLYNGVIFWLNAQKQKEPWFYRLFVAVVLIIDLLSSAFCIHTIYFWCVKNFMRPAIVAHAPWSFAVEPALTGLMAAVVHIFYAHRVVVLATDDRSSRPLFVLITVLTLIQLSFGVAVSVKIFHFDREFRRFNGWFWGACVWLGAASANDILICASYMYFLNRTSKVMAGPFERSSQAVIKVASIVLATNGLSALCAILATVLFGVFHRANWHIIVQLALAKLLALSLLIALNARTLLADLLGVDPCIFQSCGATKRCQGLSPPRNPGGGSPSSKGQQQTTWSRANGPYGHAAERGGFDMLRPPKSPGPSIVFSPDNFMVDHGADGDVYPCSAPSGNGYTAARKLSNRNLRADPSSVPHRGSSYTPSEEEDESIEIEDHSVESGCAPLR
ncbi:hypothetical protein RHOSPDRAFT_33857 [Rhodotorula sp. JG-1b]|nr:hypothetical protein RHOSPDRAFT_33857 [Rhodotorula sp. JG-1b]